MGELADASRYFNGVAFDINVPDEEPALRGEPAGEIRREPRTEPGRIIWILRL
jgi:hypothetical protein